MPCETRILWMLFAVWLIIIYELKVTFSYFRLDEAFILSPSYVHQHFFCWGQFSLMIQSVGYTGNSQAMSSIPVPRMEFIYFNTYVFSPIHVSSWFTAVVLSVCLNMLMYRKYKMFFILNTCAHFLFLFQRLKHKLFLYSIADKKKPQNKTGSVDDQRIYL